MKLANLIENIIKENKVTKQSEIGEILLKKYNKHITQSNISRILKQVNAIKVIEEGEVIYKLQDKLIEISNWIRKLIKKIDDNGFVIVLISYPGSASVIAQAIDEKNIENIISTIAGDSSLLVIPKDVSKIKELRQRLEQMFEIK